MLRYILLSALFLCAYGARLPTIPYLDGRIVGGTPATIDEAPHHVALLRFGGYTCGGTIISETIILSAAHCTITAPPSYWNVRAGSSYHNRGGQVVDVSRFVNHIDYAKPTLYNNDISLIFLKSKLIYDQKTVAKVTLPSEEQTVDDDKLSFVVGWGQQSEHEIGVLPTQLQKVNLKIINQKLCADAYENTIYTVTDNMICAGYYKVGGKDACSGDSGGSLTIDNILIGITSWGEGCARPEFPGAWTRVPKYIKWIHSNI